MNHERVSAVRLSSNPTYEKAWDELSAIVNFPDELLLW